MLSLLPSRPWPLILPAVRFRKRSGTHSGTRFGVESALCCGFPAVWRFRCSGTVAQKTGFDPTPLPSQPAISQCVVAHSSDQIGSSRPKAIPAFPSAKTHFPLEETGSGMGARGRSRSRRGPTRGPEDPARFPGRARRRAGGRRRAGAPARPLKGAGPGPAGRPRRPRVGISGPRAAPVPARPGPAGGHAAAGRSGPPGGARPPRGASGPGPGPQR